jgi:hypothetical protein
MQHAEAQERLEDLALEPGRLTRIEDDPSLEAAALRAHLAACQRCSDDLAGWRRTWALVGAAAGTPRTTGGDADGGTAADASALLRAPTSLRAKTMARIAAEGAALGGVELPGARDREDGNLAHTAGEPPSPAGMSEQRSPRRPHLPRWASWMATAAALVLALGVGSIAWNQTRDLGRAQSENAGLAATMDSLDRILATPAHWTVTLRTPDGTAGGTVAWSGSEVAVITTALPSPTAGASYRCWVERDGVRTPIGPMWFSGSTGYWAGPTDGWAALLSPGARFGVSLVPADGAPAAPVLVGSL